MKTDRFNTKHYLLTATRIDLLTATRIYVDVSRYLLSEEILIHSKLKILKVKFKVPIFSNANQTPKQTSVAYQQ